MPVILILQEGPILAWEKHCRTEKVTCYRLRYQILHRESGAVWFQLYGGPTGHESFVLIDDDGTDRHGPEYPHQYWSACAGTKGRWHECRVHKEELDRVLSEFFNNRLPYMHEDAEGNPICPNRAR